MEGSPLISVKAKYMLTTKGPAIPGVLMMAGSYFTWIPSDPKAASDLTIDFMTVKGHRFSKETPKSRKALLNMSTDGDPKVEGGYTFEFENFSDRDSCRDLVAKILGRQQTSKTGQPGPASKPSTPAPPLQIEQLNEAEMERRMRLLSEDSELQKLHQKLVIGGVLSEAEFWTTRKHLLEDQVVRLPKQRTGLKSAMLADVRPLTDGRTNKVTFNLTPEIIHQIFAEKPAVHRAYLMNVPSKMSEKDFWTKYCRAEYLYRTKNAAAIAAEAADDEDLAVFVKDDDIIANESRRKIKKVDPTLDMAADLADDYTSLPGHGILRDGNETFTNGSDLHSKKTIMHDLNRHAAVVLDGRPLDAELRDTATVAHALAKTLQAEPMEDGNDFEAEKNRIEKIRRMTELDDLKGPEGPSHSVLYIQDPRKYFEAQQISGTGELAQGSATNSSEFDPAEALKSFHQQLNNLKRPQMTTPVIPPDLAFKVLNDLTKYIASTKFHVGKTAEKNILDNLPRSIKDEILQHSVASVELLRHFWAAYPLTATFLVEKVNRLRSAMTHLYAQLQAIKETVQPDHRHQVSQLMQPIFQSLDAAFVHYDTELQKKSARNLEGIKVTGESIRSSDGMLSSLHTKS